MFVDIYGDKCGDRSADWSTDDVIAIKNGVYSLLVCHTQFQPTNYSNLRFKNDSLVIKIGIPATISILLILFH